MDGARHRRLARVAGAAVVAVVAAGLAGCSGTGDDAAPAVTTADGQATSVPPRGNVDGTLQVGTLLPATGPLAALGPTLVAAVGAAVEDINAAGGVLRRAVTLVGNADEGAEPGVAGVSVDRLLGTDRVDAVVGPASSQTALAVLGRITGANAVACSPAATALALEDFPDDGLFLRTVPTDRLQAVAVARLLTQEGYRTAGVLAPDDDYGRELAELVAQRLVADGTRVVVDVRYDPAGSDFSAVASEVVDAGPQALVLIGRPEVGGRVLRQLVIRGVGPARLPTFVTDGMHATDLFQAVDPTDPSVTTGLTATSPALVPATAKAWVEERFPATGGLAAGYAAYAYDCAVVIALAAHAAGSDDPTRIAGEIVNVTKGGVVCTTFGQCLSLLDQGRNIDYEGVSGALDFTDRAEPTAGWFDTYVYGPDGRDTPGRQVNVGP